MSRAFPREDSQSPELSEEEEEEEPQLAEEEDQIHEEDEEDGEDGGKSEHCFFNLITSSHSIATPRLFS
jgi:hypothetical protein